MDLDREVCSIQSLHLFIFSFYLSFFCFNACAKVKTYEDPNSRIVLGPHEPIFLRTSGHSKQNTSEHNASMRRLQRERKQENTLLTYFFSLVDLGSLAGVASQVCVPLIELPMS